MKTKIIQLFNVGISNLKLKAKARQLRGASTKAAAWRIGMAWHAASASRRSASSYHEICSGAGKCGEIVVICILLKINSSC